MNHSSFFLTGGRRALFGAWLLASALWAGSSFAEPQICGCEKRGKYTWPEHLQLYTNMLEAVQSARDSYAKALTAQKDVRGDWEALEGVWDNASALKNKAEGISNVGRELQSQIANFKTRENKKAVEQLLRKLEGFFGQVKGLKEEWAQLNVGAFTENLGGEVRKEEKHYGEFGDWAKRFENWYEKADHLHYTAVSLPCLKREFEALKPLKEQLGQEKEAFDKGRDKARGMRESVGKVRGDVEASFKDCDAWRTGVARTFDCPPDTGEEEILAEIRSWCKPKVKVTFRNTETIVEPIEQESGKELAEPEKPFVANGPKFLYWKERSKEGEFKEWGAPLSRNLDLEAVWAYEIRVSGVEGVEEPLMFPVERWDDVLPCSVVLGSSRLKECADKLKASAGPGREWKGWATSSDPDTPLTSRSGNIKSGTVLQGLWADAVYLVSFVVPGGTPPPVLQWTYKAEGPFPTPPALPANSADGFTYVRWSLEENGTEEWTGGVPITNNITVYAVRMADYKVRYHDEDGNFIKELGAKKGRPYDIPAGIARPFKPGNSMFEKGRVFLEWRLSGTENAFHGGSVNEDMDVKAFYRDETPEEVVRRNVRPVEAKAPIPFVAIADAALFALFVILLLTRSRTPRKTREPEGEASGEDARASAPAEEGEPGGGEGSAA